MEDEEVQALKGPLMSDLVDTIKEIRTMHQKDGNLDRLKARNAAVLRREIKLVESKYLELWKKFNKNNDYAESFLGINSQLPITPPILQPKSNPIFKIQPQYTLTT